MSGIKVLLTCFYVIALGLQAFAQDDFIERIDKAEKTKKAKTYNNAVLITPYYTALFPLGEFKSRFGFSNNAGLNISIKFKKNWVIGAEGAYLFGSRVKINPIIPITTYTSGQVIGLDGSLGDVPLQLSGFEIGLRVAKIIPVAKKHPNSGIMISLAPGYMEHKIQINANTNNYPQLDKEYRKGYDRLTAGPMISGGLGFLYLERKRFLSFYGGLEYQLGLTKEVRKWNFDTMSADNHQRIDMLIGIKLVWVIPVFLNKNEAY